MSFNQQLRITPPEGFLQEEVVTSFRIAAPPRDLKAPMAMQFQATVRPNLIVTRRLVEPSAGLAELMAGVAADLVRHLKGLSPLESTEFVFRDGAPGLLFKYTFPAHEKFSVLQFQAGRVDDGVFTTLALTTEPTLSSAEQTAQFLESIISATVRG